jgi:hypothetical protein
MCFYILDRTIGLEHELILHEKLLNLGLPFRTEDDLRTQGYQKTPDVLLDVPIRT